MFIKPETLSRVVLEDSALPSEVMFSSEWFKGVWAEINLGDIVKARQVSGLARCKIAVVF